LSSRRSSFEYIPAAAGSDAADLQGSIAAAAAAAGTVTASNVEAFAGAAAAAAGGGCQGNERLDSMLDDFKDLVYVPRGYICSSTQVDAAALLKRLCCILGGDRLVRAVAQCFFTLLPAVCATHYR
jgi:hypothetical protein